MLELLASNDRFPIQERTLMTQETSSRLMCAVAAALLALFTVTPTSSNAQPPRVAPHAPASPGWDVLGRTQASYKKDHDVIKVTGPADNYRALKFRVTDAPLNLQRIVVTYDNNSKEKLDSRQNIPQGADSRPINLRGGQRSLKKIEFWYDTKGMGKGKADVTAYGKH